MGEHNQKQDGKIPLYWAAIVIAIFVCVMCVGVVGALALFAVFRSEAVPTLAVSDKIEPTVKVFDKIEPTVQVSDQKDSNSGYVHFADQGFPPHTSMNNLVRDVAGEVIDRRSLLVTTWSEQGEPAPDYAYLFDFTATDSSKRDRSELLEIAYVLFRESFYNYSGPVVSLSLIIRASESGEAANCAFSLAMGQSSVNQYLPREKPLNLEKWLDALIANSNFGDTGISEQELVDANDPASVPSCKMRNWKYP